MGQLRRAAPPQEVDGHQRCRRGPTLRLPKPSRRCAAVWMPRRPAHVFSRASGTSASHSAGVGRERAGGESCDGERSCRDAWLCVWPPALCGSPHAKHLTREPTRLIPRCSVVSATPAKMTNHARGGLRVLCLCTVCVCVSSVLMIVCVLLFSSRRRLGRRLGVLFCVVSSDVHRISDLSRGVCVSLFRCRYRTAMLGVCQWSKYFLRFLQKAVTTYHRSSVPRSLC